MQHAVFMCSSRMAWIPCMRLPGLDGLQVQASLFSRSWEPVPFWAGGPVLWLCCASGRCYNYRQNHHQSHHPHRGPPVLLFPRLLPRAAPSRWFCPAGDHHSKAQSGTSHSELFLTASVLAGEWMHGCVHAWMDGTGNLSLVPRARDILAELHVKTLRSSEELRCGQQLGTDAEL